jgi:hypothetical protein
VSFPGPGTPDGPLHESRNVEVFAVPDMARRALEAMLPATLQGEKLRGLACLKGEKAPSEWVRTRLRVEEVAPKGPARVRLEGGRPNEALALLTALVDGYEANRRDAFVAGQIEQQVWGMRVAQGGGIRVVLNERFVPTGRQAGPAVLQRPKLISSAPSR